MTTHAKEQLSEQNESSLADIVARINEIEEKEVEIDTLIDQEPEDITDKVSEKYNQYHRREWSDLESQKALLAIMQEVSKGPLKAYIEAHFETIAKARTELTVLTEKVSKLAEQEFEAVKSFILHEINWEAFIKDALIKKKNDELELREMTNIITAALPYWDYRSSLRRLENIQKVKSRLIEGNYVLDQTQDPEKSSQGDEHFTPAEFQTLSGDIVSNTIEAYGMISQSRRTNIDNAMDDLFHITSRLSEMLRQVEYNERQSQQLKTIPPISEAIKQVFTKTVQDLDKTDESFINDERKTRPHAPLLSGLGSIKETTGLQDPAAFVYRIFERYPHTLTDGLGFIHFQEFTNEQAGNIHDELKAKGLKANAHMNHKENRIDISNLQKIYDSFIEKLGNNPPKKDLNNLHHAIQNMLADNIGHEIAHYIHFQKLPISWLRRWVEVSKKEKVVISSYSEAAKTALEDTATSGQVEVLADALSAYINVPKQLLRKAPQHFMLLQEKIGIYPQQIIDYLLHPPENVSRS